MVLLWLWQFSFLPGNKTSSKKKKKEKQKADLPGLTGKNLLISFSGWLFSSGPPGKSEVWVSLIGQRQVMSTSPHLYMLSEQCRTISWLLLSNWWVYDGCSQKCWKFHHGDFTEVKAWIQRTALAVLHRSFFLFCFLQPFVRNTIKVKGLPSIFCIVLCPGCSHTTYQTKIRNRSIKLSSVGTFRSMSLSNSGGLVLQTWLNDTVPSTQTLVNSGNLICSLNGSTEQLLVSGLFCLFTGGRILFSFLIDLTICVGKRWLPSHSYVPWCVTGN